MKFEQTPLPGVVLVEPDVYRDSRGFFLETYRQERYAEHGIDLPFVQDNHSHSRYATLRGLHCQVARPQAKLVRAVEGEMFDVAVDIRRGSPTFGRWFGAILSGESFRQLYIPEGFAHGFCVLSETVHVEYKCTEYYDPSGELSVRWSDPNIGVQWPNPNPILSPKDAAAGLLSELSDRLPIYTP